MKKLIEYYPGFYKRSEEFCQLQEVLEEMVRPLEVASNSLIKQFFIEECTWGLPVWEKLMAVTHALSGQEDSKKREIKGMLLNCGPANLLTIIDIANRFENGTLEFDVDYQTLNMTIRFSSKMGIPPNIKDMQRIIRNIVPARFAINYEFKYNRWSDVKGYLWSEVNNMTWAQLKVMEVNK